MLVVFSTKSPTLSASRENASAIMSSLAFNASSCRYLADLRTDFRGVAAAKEDAGGGGGGDLGDDVGDDVCISSMTSSFKLLIETHGTPRPTSPMLWPSTTTRPHALSARSFTSLNCEWMGAPPPVPALCTFNARASCRTWCFQCRNERCHSCMVLTGQAPYMSSSLWSTLTTDLSGFAGLLRRSAVARAVRGVQQKFQTDRREFEGSASCCLQQKTTQVITFIYFYVREYLFQSPKLILLTHFEKIHEMLHKCTVPRTKSTATDTNTVNKNN